MQLRPVTAAELPEIMSWFDSQAALTTWAGPNFRFPFTTSSFSDDLNLTNVPSYILIAPDQQLLGFGQYSLQQGHCHLSRLVIHPLFRGHGLIQILLGKLIVQGMAELKTASAALFVFRTNQAAIHAYQKAGFIEQDHPQGLLHELCSYMVLEKH